MSFVNVNNLQIELQLGRWDSRKAIDSHIECPEDAALVDLVNGNGLDKAARLIGVSKEELAIRIETAREIVACNRRINVGDLPILDLVDELGYQPAAAAEILGVPLGEIRRRYWSAREQLAGERHDEQFCRAIPTLCRRDFAAFEMIHVLNYSIGRVSRLLKINRGHLCRRVNEVKKVLAEHCRMDAVSVPEADLEAA